MSTSATSAKVGSSFGFGSSVTIASMGIVAMVTADLVHEALGHGTACLVTGNKILSLSTVAIQTAAASRFVSAAGTTAEVAIGALSLLWFGRMRRLTATSWFVWLLGVFCLMNLGYLTASAITNTSDWSNVIAGWSPLWLWRCLMGLAGVALYVLSLHWAARLIARRVDGGEIGVAEMGQIVWPAYLAAGIVMTVASLFNPIGPQLIIGSGIGPSFGLNAGLLFIPKIVRERARVDSTVRNPVSLSLVWIALALVFAAVFVTVLGPGINFVHLT